MERLESRLKFMPTPYEKQALNSRKFSDLWTPDNYTRQKFLWQYAAANSNAPIQAIERIEKLLPSESMSKNGNGWLRELEYKLYACDAASYYVMGICPHVISGFNLSTIPTFFYKMAERMEDQGLVRIEHPKKSSMTLVYLLNASDETKYHFAVDLSLKTEDDDQRILFHKPGTYPPTISTMDLIMQVYPGFSVDYWALPEHISYSGGL